MKAAVILVNIFVAVAIASPVTHGELHFSHEKWKPSRLTKMVVEGRNVAEQPRDGTIVSKNTLVKDVFVW